MLESVLPPSLRKFKKHPLPLSIFKKSKTLGSDSLPWRVVMTPDEFNTVQVGDVLLNYDGMRNWIVLAREGQTLVLQTTRTLSNYAGQNLDTWSIVIGKDQPIEPPPF